MAKLRRASLSSGEVVGSLVHVLAYTIINRMKIQLFQIDQKESDISYTAVSKPRTLD
jgi:hypothetical protein